MRHNAREDTCVFVLALKGRGSCLPGVSRNQLEYCVIRDTMDCTTGASSTSVASGNTYRPARVSLVWSEAEGAA